MKNYNIWEIGGILKCKWLNYILGIKLYGIYYKFFYKYEELVLYMEFYGVFVFYNYRIWVLLYYFLLKFFSNKFMFCSRRF